MPKTVGADIQKRIFGVRIPPTEEKSIYDMTFTSQDMFRHIGEVFLCTGARKEISS